VVPTNCRSMNTCARGTSASMRNVPSSATVSIGAAGAEDDAGPGVDGLAGRRDGVGAEGRSGVPARGVERGATGAGDVGAGVTPRSTRGRVEFTITSTPITNAKQKVARARRRRDTRRFYVTDASTRMHPTPERQFGVGVESRSGARGSGSGTRDSGLGIRNS
jgi:hypothetical protein